MDKLNGSIALNLFLAAIFKSPEEVQRVFAFQYLNEIKFGKLLRIKISEKSFALRSDVAMTSFSCDKVKIQTVLYMR